MIGYLARQVSVSDMISKILPLSELSSVSELLLAELRTSTARGVQGKFYNCPKPI